LRTKNIVVIIVAMYRAVYRSHFQSSSAVANLSHQLEPVTKSACGSAYPKFTMTWISFEITLDFIL